MSATSGRREPDGGTGNMSEGARVAVGSLTFCGPQDREHWLGEGGPEITREHLIAE
jgi:hypothetical protein